MLEVREICRKALAKLLIPVVRFALRNSLKQRDVLEYLKIAFVTVAQNELSLIGSQITASKLSAITGIQRKEINRLLDESYRIKRDQDIIARVVGLWQSATEFQDSNGAPKPLQLGKRQGSFVKLVSGVSTDLNPYTVQFELERLGLVHVENQIVTLIKPGYEPSGDLEKSLALLADDSDFLYRAVTENVFENIETPNLHVTTFYDNIPKDKEEEVRTWLLERGASFHEEIRNYLSKLDRDISKEAAQKYPEEPAISVAVGTFSLTTNKH